MYQIKFESFINPVTPVLSHHWVCERGTRRYWCLSGFSPCHNKLLSLLPSFEVIVSKILDNSTAVKLSSLNGQIPPAKKLTSIDKL